MADDEPRDGPTRADAVRLGVFLLVLAVAGAWTLVAEWQRPGSDGVLLAVLGAAMLLGLVGMGIAIGLVHLRDRRLPPAERAAARRARYAEARERRPAWLDSRGFQVFSGVLAAYWLYLLVVGALAGSVRQVVVSGLFLTLSVGVVVRVQRRRAASGR